VAAPEQRGQQPDVSKAILNASGMNDRVHQQTLHVDENIAFLECDGEGISTNRSVAGLSEG
jgi:hypothetical protein